MKQTSSRLRRFAHRLLVLGAVALGTAAPLASAQTFTPTDVFWETSLADPNSPVNSQQRMLKVNAGGDFLTTTAFAITPDRIYGQAAFTNDRTVGYIPSFFINRVLTVTPAGVVNSASPFATGLNRPTGLLVVRTGANAGKLLCASFGQDRILDITTGGDFTSAPSFATGTPSARNIVQLANGTLLVAASNGVRNITAGGASTSFASGFAGRDLVQTANGKIYATTDTGNVFDITAGGSFLSATAFANGQVFIGLAVDGAGRLLASVSNSATHRSAIFDITAGGNFSAATPFATNLPGDSETALDTVPGDPISVTTVAASGISGYVATINGTANPGGLAGTGVFEYGLTPALGSTSGTVSVGSGTTTVPFSKQITGLTPNTLYYFRAKVSNALYGATGTTLNFTTGGPNTAPDAIDDSVHPPANLVSFTVDVLANDTDVDFDPLTVTAVAGGTFGTPSVTAGGGSATYAPGVGYDGNDTFTYTISDGQGGNDTATVTLHNAAPMAMDDSVHPPAGLGAFAINVLTNDTDPDLDALTVMGVAGGAVGTPSVTAGGGSVTYTPGVGYAGNDSFTYTVTDGRGAISTGTVTLHNAAPVANPDSTLLTSGAVTVNVLVNDTDTDAGDNAAFAVTAVTNGTYGTVTNNATNVTYTQNAPFIGSDSFTYTMTDGRGATAIGTVTIETIVGICNHTGQTVVGAPAGSTYKTFGTPSVVDGGIEAFKASISTPAGTRYVIVAGNPPAVVVTKGDAAPALPGVLISTFKDPVLNSTGAVAFLSALSGAVTTADNYALFTTLGGTPALVAREGQLMPGGPALNTLKSFKSVAITDTAVFFTGQLAIGPGGVSSATDFGLWVWHPGTGLEAVVIESDIVDGKQVKTIASLTSVSQSQGQGRSTHGDLALMRLTFTDNKQAIYKMIGATDIAVVAADDTLTSGIVGAKFVKFGIPGLNANGDVAFTGFLASNVGGVVSATNVGIFAGANAASLDLVAQKGQAAPDVAATTFASFKDPLYNSDQDVAFVGVLAGTGLTSITKYGIWADDDDAGFHLVARGGDQPPGTSAGVQWASFTSAVLPDHLGPVFTAKLVLNPGLVEKTSAFGLWARDGLGATYLLTRTGDALTVNAAVRNVRSIYALNAASGSPAQGRAYSHDGAIIYRVKFVDGSEAILCATLPIDEGLPE